MWKAQYMDMMTPAAGKTVAIYLRVSTDEQTVENQRQELMRAAQARGWRVVGEYCDEGLSGAYGRDKRPAWDRLRRHMVRGRFSMVAAWSVDRLGRSMRDLVGFLEELRASGCDLYLDRQGVDTSTPAGRAMFQMLGVFAEFERSLIQDRIRAGIGRARKRGTKSGKPFGRPALDRDREARVRQLLSQGVGINKTARLVGTGNATVARIKAEMAAATVETGNIGEKQAGLFRPGRSRNLSGRPRVAKKSSRAGG
jgi:DNA invertase Pin-like site-specific DNA recombinase